MQPHLGTRQIIGTKEREKRALTDCTFSSYWRDKTAGAHDGANAVA
jgi:hypothetical protein